MSNTLNKFLSILTIAMLVITVILVGLLFLGGDVPNAADTTPVYTDSFLVYAYILFGLSTVIAVAFPVFQMIANPKAGLKALGGIAILGAVILVSYAMADGTLLDLPGYTGDDNVKATLEFADMTLYTMYILGVGAVAAIVVTEIVRKLR